MSALAAATGTAKTAKLAECEASQSGGEAVTPNPLLPSSEHNPVREITDTRVLTLAAVEQAVRELEAGAKAPEMSVGNWIRMRCAQAASPREITDEMIEAGYSALLACKPIMTTDCEREACEAIYLDMQAASPVARNAGLSDAKSEVQRARDLLNGAIEKLVDAEVAALTAVEEQKTPTPSRITQPEDDK